MKILTFNSLTRTYILALSFIAFLTIVGSLTMYLLIITQTNSALLVNMSGSQRMLSQKVALLSLELVYPQIFHGRDEVRTELLATIQTIEKNHQILMENRSQNPRSLNTLLPFKEVNASVSINLQTQLLLYTSEARSIANQLENELTPANPHLTYILQTREKLLNSLDQIVTQYQQESEAKVFLIQILQLVICLIILLALVIVGLYIFRPLAHILQNERTQLQKANQVLLELSSLDGLTGIANRRYFDEFLIKIWSLQTRNAGKIAIIMCDIDFFKAYNDNYGHLQGDECLKVVATILKKSLKREGDLIARYGGEEFVVILPNTDREGALNVAATLRTNIENERILHEHSAAASVVTISLGVSIGQADPRISPISLIKAADEALYLAKKDGRNCYKLAGFPT